MRPAVSAAGAHCAADGPEVRGALQEERQERRQRRGGGMRGGDTPDHALCSGQEHRAAGRARAHRVRHGFVVEHTAVIDRVRGVVAEFGVVLPLRSVTVRREAAAAAEGLPPASPHSSASSTPSGTNSITSDRTKRSISKHPPPATNPPRARCQARSSPSYTRIDSRCATSVATAAFAGIAIG